MTTTAETINAITSKIDAELPRIRYTTVSPDDSGREECIFIYNTKENGRYLYIKVLEGWYVSVFESGKTNGKWNDWIIKQYANHKLTARQVARFVTDFIGKYYG